MLGNLFNSQPQTAPSAPTPTAAASSTSTVPQSSTASGQSSNAPSVDEHGFPLDEGYLREQGLNLVDLNREFVQQQEIQQQLLQVLSDPNQRAEFLAALDGNNTQVNDPNAAQPPAQRQTFPGGAPGQQQQPQTLEGYYNQIKEATRVGYPVDNLPAVYQMWDSIPDAAWRELAGTLIQGDY